MKIGRNDPCWCGSGKKYKHCHEALDERLMAESDKGHIVPTRDLLKTPEQIEKIRESCAVNIAVLDYVAEHIGAGITTEEIDKWVYDETVKRGGIPAPLGYEGFPKSVCTSINEQVCHGIPSELPSPAFIPRSCTPPTPPPPFPRHWPPVKAALPARCACW